MVERDRAEEKIEKMEENDDREKRAFPFFRPGCIGEKRFAVGPNECEIENRECDIQNCDADGVPQYFCVTCSFECSEIPLQKQERGVCPRWPMSKVLPFGRSMNILPR